ncbi:MAG: efflux RND transporter permease subunit, partial [Bacteroidia bacterium]
MKEFKPTSWSINNKTSIYILTIIISLAGIFTYNSLQKEQFPDIVIPTIFVGTVYPGTSPADMENLVTRPLEKHIKAISGVKKITSNSVQDFSSISVEFNTDVDVKYAKDQVKDAVDKSRMDLPVDLPADPNVMEINFADFPIMYVNISGDIEMDKLKKYAEDMQDRIESLSEITRVDIVGALDKEIQVNVDLYKMQATKLTFGDIQRALQYENMTISGGGVTVGDMKRNIRIVGQFTTVEEIGNVIIKNALGSPIYLKDIAEVIEGFEERESYARLDNSPVITLNIVKRSGENLIEASDKIRDIVAEMKEISFPKNLKVTITADQSTQTRHTLNDLINTIIIGFILVTLILMFFMGTVNALFVGLSVPISMFLAFMIMPFIGSTFGFTYSLNMIVLFSFLLALGIVVDDAIVVIENTHRIYHEDHKMSIRQAAKFAAGEVFIPVFAGTLTTLAPFFPLLFWPGIFGKFMLYLPVTLIITLTASLLVAFVMNPVFAVSFMKREHGEAGSKSTGKGFRYWMIGLAILALIFYIAGNIGIGNLITLIIILVFLNKYVFTKWIKSFQESGLPRLMNGYERLLTWMLKGRRPILVFLSVFGLLILSVIVTIVRQPKVEFFPKGDPNFVYVYLTMPVGTDIKVTDSITRVLEKRVYSVIGKANPDVESVISNVAIGAGDPSDFGGTQATPHKGKVGVAFKEFQHRTGPNTMTYLDKIREAVKGIPAAEIIVDQESAGPPTGKPVNIEISGEDYTTLIALAKRTERY